MRKGFKTLIILFITISMILMYISCGEESTVAAENAVTKAFTALQSGDVESADQYMNADDLTEFTNMEFNEDDVQKEQILTIIKALFTHFDYEILSSEEQKDGTVQVKARLSNVDRKEVADTWSAEIMKIGMKACGLEDAEIQRKIDSLKLSDVTFYAMSKKDIQEMVDASEDCVEKAAADQKFESCTTILRAEKTDGKWKLHLDKEQREFIFGAFTKVMNSV